MVSYEKKDRIAYITLNRPERLNAIDEKMATDLMRIWVDFRDDDNLLVAILSGSGRSFCSGADVSKMALGQYWTFPKNSLLFGEKRIGPHNYGVWKPIIAAVHGHVLGAGFYLTLECDLKIAAEDATLGLPEPKVGIPTLFAPLLSYYLTDSHAMELLLLGNSISARRAYEMGLINRVVPPEELPAAAEEMAHRLCQNGPLSIRAMKEVYYRSRGMEFPSMLDLIIRLFTPVMNSTDAVEGKIAFLEKRQPQWKSR